MNDKFAFIDNPQKIATLSEEEILSMVQLVPSAIHTNTKCERVRRMTEKRNDPKHKPETISTMSANHVFKMYNRGTSEYQPKNAICVRRSAKNDLRRVLKDAEEDYMAMRHDKSKRAYEEHMVWSEAFIQSVDSENIGENEIKIEALEELDPEVLNALMDVIF